MENTTLESVRQLTAGKIHAVIQELNGLEETAKTYGMRVTINDRQFGRLGEDVKPGERYEAHITSISTY